MKNVRIRRQSDSIISLINIVFLILIFFMVTGTLAPPIDGSIRFVQTRDLECCMSPDAIALNQDGIISYQGQTLESVEAFVKQYVETNSTEISIIPDQNLPAVKLLETVKIIKSAGAKQIFIVTEDNN